MPEYKDLEASTLYALEFEPNQTWNAGTIGHNAYHGHFWAINATPGDCFWEAWVAPENLAAYFISAGFGGSHVVLLGFDAAGSGKMGITGNVYDGSGNVTFNSVDTVDPGSWHHVALGVDHTLNFIYVYLDGVITNKVSFTGTRTVGPGSSDVGLYVGGSDHSNYKGKILRIRGFENQIPFGGSVFPATFWPQTVFNSTLFNGGTGAPAAQFAVDYSRPSEALIDYSSGYNGTTHSGKRSIGNYGGQGSSDALLPQWVLAEFTKPTYLGSVESIPSGAIVFDDFSRANETFAWAGGEYTEYPWIGTSRTGQAWSGVSGGAPAGQGDVGIIEGAACAVHDDLANPAYAFIDANATDYTMTITRRGTGIIYAVVRRADASNHLVVVLTSTVLAYAKTLAGVPSDPGGGGAITDNNWTVATITVNGTSISTSVGGSTFPLTENDLTGDIVGIGVVSIGRVERFLVAP